MKVTIIGKQYVKGSNDNGSYEYYKIYYTFVSPQAGFEGLMCESRNIYPSNEVFKDLPGVQVNKLYDLDFTVVGKNVFVSSLTPVYGNK